MKIGIIIGRFQCPYLHEGHMALINHVLKKSEKVAIFIGGSAARITTNDPLSYEARKKMLESSFPDVSIFGIADRKYDEAWDKALDRLIDEEWPNDDVVLYGSRDSFLRSYKGRHKTEEFEAISSVSATNIRKATHDYVDDSVEWREGIVFASAYKYPISYQAVDIAIVNFDKKQVLLGRKEGEPGWRFVGGFVDVEDASLEMAAKREAREECGDIETDAYKYLGSFRIDDWRYRKSNDKIMTAFFCCHYIYGRVNPQDDIAELQWFDLDALDGNIFEPEHRILYISLRQYLNANIK